MSSLEDRTAVISENFSPSLKVCEALTSLSMGTRTSDTLSLQSLRELDFSSIEQEFSHFRLPFQEPGQSFEPVTFVKPEVSASSDAEKIKMRQAAVKEVYDHPHWQEKLDTIIYNAMKLKPFLSPVKSKKENQEGGDYLFYLTENSKQAQRLVTIIEGLKNLDFSHPYLVGTRNFAEKFSRIKEYQQLKSFVNGWRHISTISSRTYFDQQELDMHAIAKEIAFGRPVSTFKRIKELRTPVQNGFVTSPIHGLMQLIYHARNRTAQDDEVETATDERTRDLPLSTPNIRSRREMYFGLTMLQSFYERLMHTPSLQSVIDFKEIKDFDIPSKLKIAQKELKLLSDVPPFSRKRMDDFELNTYMQIGNIADHALQIIHDGLYRLTFALEQDIKINKFQNIARHLSVYNALAKMGRHYDKVGVPKVLPQIVNESENRIEIKNGYSPSLIFAHENKTDTPLEESKTRLNISQIVANDFSLGSEHRTGIVTGPNNNGKTTYLRTLSQLVYLAQLGGYIPASEAIISPRASMFASIVKSDSPKEKMGLYKTQLSFIRDILSPAWLKREYEHFKQHPPKKSDFDHAMATDRSLLLFDEFAIGTDEQEAIARTNIILNEITKRGSLTLLSTHYHELASQVKRGELSLARNIGMMVRKNPDGSLTHTYKAEFDATEASHGYLLANELGITRDGFEKTRDLFLNIGIDVVKTK